MSVDEVTPMAKTKTTTKSSSPKAATKTAVKKAAPKKAAAPKSDAKVAAPKKTAAKKAAAPKAGGVKKAAAKKPIKLTDAQANLLKEVLGTKDAGLVASKKIQKQLDALQTKKLIKRGKKEGAFYKYHGTKLGEKHQASTGSSESTPAAS
jgi:hypothetical protein